MKAIKKISWEHLRTTNPDTEFLLDENGDKKLYLTETDAAAAAVLDAKKCFSELNCLFADDSYLFDTSRMYKKENYAALIREQIGSEQYPVVGYQIVDVDEGCPLASLMQRLRFVRLTSGRHSIA